MPLAYQDLPHQLNTTNFHFHGSHVSPEGISDNIFRDMRTGQSYEIEIAIPDDHTPGPTGITRIIMAAPTSRSPAAWPAR